MSGFLAIRRSNVAKIPQNFSPSKKKSTNYAGRRLIYRRPRPRGRIDPDSEDSGARIRSMGGFARFRSGEKLTFRRGDKTGRSFSVAL